MRHTAFCMVVSEYMVGNTAGWLTANVNHFRKRKETVLFNLAKCVAKSEQDYFIKKERAVNAPRICSLMLGTLWMRILTAREKRWLMWKKGSVRWIWWSVSKGMWKSTFFLFPYLVWEIQESADTIGLVAEDQREKSLERQRKRITHRWKTRVLKVRVEKREGDGAGGQGKRKMTCQGRTFRKGQPGFTWPFFGNRGAKRKAALTEAGCQSV